MKTTSAILQLLGFLVGIFGSIGGLASLGGIYGFTSGLTIILSSVITGVLLGGIGQALSCLEDIALDTERSADANERAAHAIERMAGMAATHVEDLPPVSRVRSIKPHRTNLEKLLGRRN